MARRTVAFNDSIDENDEFLTSLRQSSKFGYNNIKEQMNSNSVVDSVPNDELEDSFEDDATVKVSN